MKTKMYVNNGKWEKSINILASALNVQGAPRDGGTRRYFLLSFSDANSL